MKRALWAVLAVGMVSPVWSGEAARRLVVQPEDLPGSFTIQGGDDQPGGAYLAVYLRPEVLTADALPGGALLGVMASVEITANRGEAIRRFLSDSSVEALQESVRRSAQASSPAEVEALSSDLEADDTALFRLAYRMAGVEVVEYRYRLRVGEIVANVMVTGRTGSGGAEPSDLAAQASAIAGRQLARLEESGPGRESG